MTIGMDETWPHPNRLTAQQWNEITVEDRQAYHDYWQQQGLVVFVCLYCWFPLGDGDEYCDACIERNR